MMDFSSYFFNYILQLLKMIWKSFRSPFKDFSGKLQYEEADWIEPKSGIELKSFRNYYKSILAFHLSIRYHVD